MQIVDILDASYTQNNYSFIEYLIERAEEKRKNKKEKIGIKRERKLNQSFQEHAVIGL